MNPKATFLPRLVLELSTRAIFCFFYYSIDMKVGGITRNRSEKRSVCGHLVLVSRYWYETKSKQIIIY